MPDFIIRLKSDPPIHLILETKGYDPLADLKKGAADRWVRAVNADDSYGKWAYTMVRQVSEVNDAVTRATVV
jgi:type III restriction enzyme